jgi:hypothetical protein
MNLIANFLTILMDASLGGAAGITASHDRNHLLSTVRLQ